ncbi:MAG: hypothetical protein GF308_13175 [Candidatus Heimdallarchaeota archaeon]|nr:hypothetical protein [Candidatus Heimdallarchaeota archaeon]
MFRSNKKDQQKTLWTEYPDYEPINNIEEKPLYDESRVNDQHKVLGEIIRQNWDLIHPLAKDYLLSSAIEWRRLLMNEEKIVNELENKKKLVEEVKADYELKIQRLQLEKDAELEKVKEEITEHFREKLEAKDQEIKHYKMLAESMQSSFDSTQQEKDSLSEEIEKRREMTAEQTTTINELRELLRKKEEESKVVQEEISTNFQKQISKMSIALQEKSEQIKALREVLEKAKNQLIKFKEQNKELQAQNKEFRQEIDILKKRLLDRETKIKRVVDTLNKS